VARVVIKTFQSCPCHESTTYVCLGAAKHKMFSALIVLLHVFVHIAHTELLSKIVESAFLSSTDWSCFVQFLPYVLQRLNKFCNVNNFNVNYININLLNFELSVINYDVIGVPWECFVSYCKLSAARPTSYGIYKIDANTQCKCVLPPKMIALCAIEQHFRLCCQTFPFHNRIPSAYSLLPSPFHGPANHHKVEA
jgi:hypothetical protein